MIYTLKDLGPATMVTGWPWRVDGFIDRMEREIQREVEKIGRLKSEHDFIYVFRNIGHSTHYSLLCAEIERCFKYCYEKENRKAIVSTQHIEVVAAFYKACKKHSIPGELIRIRERKGIKINTMFDMEKLGNALKNHIEVR